MDQVSLQSEDGVAGAAELGIAEGISDAAVSVHFSIHLHDEPDRGSEEIRDGATNGNLPAEGNAQAFAANGGKESGLKAPGVVRFLTWTEPRTA